jgi:anti-sigma B factor antagonist
MNERPGLAIITEHQSQRSVVRLQGQLDVSTRDRLRLAIGSALEGPPPMFVVDLSGLDFADCAGISILVWAQKRLAEGGSELVVTGAKPIVRRLLQLTGLDTYLHLGTLEFSNDPLLAKHSQVVRHGPGGPGWSAHSV